jgi:hypothetical protein
MTALTDPPDRPATSRQITSVGRSIQSLLAGFLEYEIERLRQVSEVRLRDTVDFDWFSAAFV